ncbi:MAG: alpha/beta hydrolase [Actinomycetota bacterium]|nr:alpha/beta hydrolase [Actinomycetota bacterium]
MRQVTPAEPVVCLPGGPLRASRYLGNLGGLDAHRELVLLDLPPRRVDRLVGDVEALRERLGRERLDILAHSAGAALAMLYAAAHPDRVGRLALVTPSNRAVGIPPTDEEWIAALELRAGEPWYAAARAAADAWDAGDASWANRLAAAPFFYGRWDAAAQAHAAGEAEEATPDAGAIYYADGALDPSAARAGLAGVTAEVLVLAGGLDFQPTERAATELVGLFPHAVLVVQPGAGHFPWVDDPVAFAATLAGFFNS